MLTAVTFVSVLCVWLAVTQQTRPEESERRISLTQLAVLTFPFCAAYFAALMPRALTAFIVERYLLFLIPFFALWLLAVHNRLPAKRIGTAGLLAACAVALLCTAALHDLFALYRANLDATERLLAAGVPRTQISAGSEYNFSTQLLHTQYVPMSGIRLPGGRLSPELKIVNAGPCDMHDLEITPVVHAVYFTAAPQFPCERATQFAPIPFRTWLPPFRSSVVIDRSQSTSPDRR